MKRKLIFIGLILPICLFIKSQSLTIEYNIGHGSYEMSDMKKMLKTMLFPLNNVVVTDNFSGYLTQDARIGMEWKRNHIGVLFNYMNTAGKKGVADYSGYNYYTVRNKGYKLGAFYRFFLANEKLGPFTFEPYIQFSTGIVLDAVKVSEAFFVDLAPEQGYQNRTKYSGMNFFVEPALGIKFKLCRYAALNVSIAYEWDVYKDPLLTGGTDEPFSVDVDWSGYRAQAGLIFYLNLNK